MNLPNKLTILRILLVPLLMFFLFLSNDFPQFSMILALITFVLAALTDSLDGYLARKYENVTKFGKIVDPLADKLLISAALISFVELGEISAWAAIIIIGRELAITGLRVVAASEGVVISASKWGKSKTVLQITAIIILMLDPHIINFPWNIENIVLWAAVLMTIYSGYIYFRNANIDFFREEKS
ncbi:MAG: CDP-diacylglycerol--glycerol-3-phosphate 3-phosphatidyltransferase [Bacillota bacterium]